MKNILLIAGLLISSTSFAAALKQERFEAYNLFNSEKNVTIQVVVEFETPDTCNEFGLSGNFRRVEDLDPSIRQDFVADFGVSTTKMRCPPSIQSRKVRLVSEKFEVSPLQGIVSARILVPENMKLNIIETAN